MTVVAYRQRFRRNDILDYALRAQQLLQIKRRLPVIRGSRLVTPQPFAIVRGQGATGYTFDLRHQFFKFCHVRAALAVCTSPRQIMNYNTQRENSHKKAPAPKGRGLFN